VCENKFLKSVNIWQSYKQERGCLLHFARLANTLLKDEESLRLCFLAYPVRKADFEIKLHIWSHSTKLL